MQDETTIQEDFERARQRAVALTDAYLARPADDPLREALWRDVTTETERARLLLERWLDQSAQRAPVSAADARVPVLA